MLDDLINCSKEELPIIAQNEIDFAMSLQDAFVVADRLIKIGELMKEKCKDQIANITDTINTPNYTIKVTKIPVYKYVETHELSTLGEQLKKVKGDADSIADLIKNIKKQQEINGLATKEKDNYRREVI